MFDPVTLVVALAIAHIAGTAALVAVWAVNPQVPGIVAWIVGRVMIGISFAMLPLQFGLPRIPVVVAAGLLAVAGLMVATVGSRQFMGRRPFPSWLTWGMPLLYAAILWTLLETRSEIARQVSITSAGIFVVCALNAVSLWPARGDAVRVSSRLMACIFGYNALFFLVRAAFGAIHPSPETQSEASWDITITLLNALIISVMVATTYTAMVTEYLQADLKRQAELDPLTGLHNRRSFDTRAGEAIRRARRFGGSLALLYLDLDQFKAINDRFGHPAGDEVLRQLAEIVTASLRDSDLSARLGGEEFAILLPRVDCQAALAVAERIRRGMQDLRFDGHDEPFQVTVSIGLATFDHSGDDLDRLSRRADQALYRAKEEGRNRTVIGTG